MRFPVFDLHCDTALALLGKTLDSIGDLRKNRLHIDLERAGALPAYAQCFACFTTDLYKKGPSPVTVFEREMAAILQQIQKNEDIIRQVYTPEEIEKNRKTGCCSAILTIEGPAGFDFNPDLLEDLYKIGFRITTLGWNECNPLTGSHLTGQGLTELGRAYVVEAQRVGMLVDVSHISDQGFWDIMDITTGPVIASHSNSRAVWNVSRNLTDEMFLAICKTGGVVGINLYTDFLGPDATVDTVCDHILHFMSIDHTGQHIALGGDLDGCESLPAEFTGIESYPKLADALLKRGVSEAQVENIFWNNAIGVMKNAIRKHKK